jgi:L,D-peptidoglycan transpeptidase YkuD (ErfK/YbiS/YcfS/YnhG family)
MLIEIKNKDTLIIDDFIFRCVIGKKGIKSKKIEGDKCTPRGTYSIGKLYYRKDRLDKPKTQLSTQIIKKNLGWCDDPNNKYYNSQIKIDNKIKCEKLFRLDHTYDCLIVINYNVKNTKPYKGSAIFIHLTKNYKKTLGCIALKKKDFLILAKLINKKTKIKIH